MKNAVLITGTNGGIGAAIKRKFESQGYSIIGCGLSTDMQSCEEYIRVDFARLATDSEMQQDFEKRLRKILNGYNLCGLINNSAVQILSNFESLSFKDFQETLNVNLSVPFLLSKICLSSLKATAGMIVNIGSVHANQTKKQFVAYATSKGALQTMTKAMAVDVGCSVRVNMVAPAAINTDMLREGFRNNEAGYKELANYHPTGDIGSVDELACFVYMIVAGDYKFLNGAIIEYTGGIHGVLSDPQKIF